MDAARHDVEELLGPLNEVEKKNAPEALHYTRLCSNSHPTLCRLGSIWDIKATPARSAETSPSATQPTQMPILGLAIC